MEARIKHGIQVTSALVVAWLLLPLPVVADTPNPTTSNSSVNVTQSRPPLVQTLELNSKGPDADLKVQFDSTEQGSALSSVGRPIPPSKTVPTQRCGYFSLSAEELASPGVWAGALQANTGDLIPGRFSSAD